ncbi:hypothetical protein COV82_02895 [Candidatus Peregrinibacteria bacterium CG11_big_fil_rev_8_21_14_0_20_46_8]|nr:MAG: hypothetical protein COV82_02895 [Candidatus Peregrinibacteria bacterium CG11_big_fil_rev_8_21_14_0_20_46_8]
MDKITYDGIGGDAVEILTVGSQGGHLAGWTLWLLLFLFVGAFGSAWAVRSRGWAAGFATAGAVALYFFFGNLHFSFAEVKALADVWIFAVWIGWRITRSQSIQLLGEGKWDDKAMDVVMLIPLGVALAGHNFSGAQSIPGLHALLWVWICVLDVIRVRFPAQERLEHAAAIGGAVILHCLA